MLQHLPRAPQMKNLHLQISDPSLAELIEQLAVGWGYRLTADPAEDPLLLISAGLPRPTGFHHLLILSPSQYAGRLRLALPLSIESLYLALENHFHRTPRNHIRINLEWPIQVRARDQLFETHSVTIADRGLRFNSPLELVRGEALEIHIDRQDEVYNLHARVVYAINEREIGRGNGIGVGAVCVPQSKEVRESIRSRIIGNYLKRVRPLMDSRLFHAALKQLDLPKKARQLAEFSD